MMIFKLKSDLFTYRLLDLDRKKTEAGADLNSAIRDRVYIVWG